MSSSFYICLMAFKININRGIFLIIMLFACPPITGQMWEFQKEKHGIELYTRKMADSSLKAYKATMDLEATPEEIIRVLTDYDNYMQWDSDIKNMEVLSCQDDSVYVFYMVYKVPWPFQNRDRVARALVDRSINGTITMESRPAPEAKEEVSGITRIADFHEAWTLIPENQERTHVIMEGYSDPGGNIPSWIINMAIVNAPFKTMDGLRREFD